MINSVCYPKMWIFFSSCESYLKSNKFTKWFGSKEKIWNTMNKNRRGEVTFPSLKLMLVSAEKCFCGKMGSFWMKGELSKPKMCLKEHLDSIFPPKSVLLLLLRSGRVFLTQTIISGELFNPTVWEPTHGCTLLLHFPEQVSQTTAIVNFFFMGKSILHHVHLF